MRSIIAIVCLGLLLCIQPAMAQKEHTLTVSIHADLLPKLTQTAVEKALAGASALLNPPKNQCDVTFKLRGPIKPFAPGTPKKISNEDDLEAVHREDADVKVVEKIAFCMGRPGTFIGCAWRRNGPKTMIVALQPASRRHIVWAHEFGHVAGLQHRADPGALRTPCDIFFDHVKITPEECDCFRAGPGGCHIPEPDPAIACTEAQR
jgi:hypothetical protein